MTRYIDRLFKLREYRNSESEITAKMIRNTSIGLVVLSLFFVLGASLIAPALVRRAIVFTVIVTITAIGVMVLLRRQRFQAAGIALATAMWLIVTLGSIAAGGISAPIVMGYIIVILISGLIANRKISIYFSIACILTSILITFAEINKILPQSTEYTPIWRMSIYVFFFMVAMLLQNVNTQNMRELLKQAQNSEAQYKKLLENTPTTTYINSPDISARTEYVSPQVEKLLGYSRNDFLSDPLFWRKILHPADSQKVLDENLHGVETEQPFEMEYRLIARDGRVVWVRDEANLVHDENGKPQYWLGIWTDITTQKHAEEEQADLIGVMTKRTIQLQTAAEVSRAASSILDLDKLLPAVVELIRSHFDYYYVGIFLVDESREWALLSAATGEMGKQMLSTGHRLKVENSSMIGWCISHGQARIALDVGGDAVRFKNPYLSRTRSEMALPLIARGEVIGAMTIQSELPAAFSRVDITALQTMADQVGNAIKNASLFTEKVKLNKELEGQNAELERFTYTVSHDLKSPLVTIRGFLGYLREDATSGDMTRFDKDLGRIANAVDKMQALLNDLLELSRVGRIINPPEDVPFEKIVQEARDLVLGPSEEARLKLIIHPGLPIIHGDHARLVEVIQNLLSNAVKFMGDQPEPRIEIGMTEHNKDGKLVFYMQDNGIGINPQYHERIFGLFNRLDPNINGTGIGLTLVRRIIEVHGGRIWVESEGTGKGATFFFSLPGQGSA